MAFGEFKAGFPEGAAGPGEPGRITHSCTQAAHRSACTTPTTWNYCSRRSAVAVDLACSRRSRPAADLALAVTNGQRRPPPPGSPVPARLRRVVQRGLEVSPTERWPDMRALLQAAGAARRPDPPQPPAHARGRERAGAWGCGEGLEVRPRSACDGVRGGGAIEEVWIDRAVGAPDPDQRDGPRRVASAPPRVIARCTSRATSFGRERVALSRARGAAARPAVMAGRARDRQPRS